MFRVIFFLVLIGAAAFGAAWIADQSGDVVLSWGGWRAETTAPVFALIIGILLLGAMAVWALIRETWRLPKRLRRIQRERRRTRGRDAVTRGLLAIGYGDAVVAHREAKTARKLTPHDPLALLLTAQTAQLEGNREAAHKAFSAMAERDDTRLLGLRGLFVEAQRADDAPRAMDIAEEAVRIAPGSTWASHALLGLRCAEGDWAAALKLLDGNLASGLLDKATYKRQRGVLLTARALDVEATNRDLSRESVLEAVKLAPTLIPAAVLAAKFESEANQIRRAMRVLEAAWLAQPHPDIADAYAHVKLGDSAVHRLARIESLAAKTPGNIEGALAVARASIDAADFAHAREVLAPFVEAPTQRVAMLMAELERAESGDSGRARTWTLRAVRAALDPAWTADGYISDRWRPVSPVTGRLDAFQWQTPVAALPMDKAPVLEPDVEAESLFIAAQARPAAAPVQAAVPDPITSGDAQPSLTPVLDAGVVAAPVAAELEAPKPTPEKTVIEPAVILVPDDESLVPPAAATAKPADDVKPAADAARAAQQSPLFRSRPDIGKPATAAFPPVIPIVRPPDDPGIDEENAPDEFARLNGAGSQPGGWRGFISRWTA